MQNKKILLVFTGGTISSKESDGIIEKKQKTYTLLSDKNPEDFHILSPFDILSENMTPEYLFSLCREMRKALSQDTYRAVIITHGTDTLSYTAQMISLLFETTQIPFVLLGSKRPQNASNFDGKINFDHALLLLDLVSEGVYVVSRHENGSDRIYAASHILQADCISDDFSSYRGQAFASIEKNQVQLSPDFQKAACYPTLLSLFSEKEPSGDIHAPFIISPYIGLDYRQFNIENYQGKSILHLLYHSGTACTEGKDYQNLLLFSEKCQKEGKTLYLAPIEKGRAFYESASSFFHSSSIVPIYDTAPERAYAMLLLSEYLEISAKELFSL